MDWLRADLRDALRLLTRRPIHSLLAVVTLAIGLGLNALAFSVVNALLFRPDRVGAGENIGWITVTRRAEPEPLANMSLPMYERVQRDARTLASVAAEGRLPLAYQTGDATRQIWALVVSPGYFSTVDVPLARGRTWRLDEATPDRVVVLVSERFWRLHLGATPDLSGLSIAINQQTAHVLGVVDDEFEGPGGFFAPDVVVPLTVRRTLGLPDALDGRTLRWLNVLARPGPGATAAAIAGDLLPIVREELEGVSAADDVSVSYARIADGNPDLDSVRSAAALGLAAVFTVLLIACFNVAGLLVARSVERQREFGIRSALGASRARLVRQLAIENLLVAGLAAALALAIARWSAMLLSAFSLPSPIPQRLHFPLDWRLVGYTALLAGAAATIPALGPAWQVVKTDLTAWLKAGGGTGSARRQARARRAFVLVQTSGSTFFLAAALLFGQGLLNALSQDVGFDVDHTVAAEIDPFLYRYTPEASMRLVSQLREDLNGRSGVRSVAVADRLPFTAAVPHSRPLSLDGRDCRVSRCVEADTYAVDEHFFDALRIPVRAGRALLRTDTEAVVINETAAAQFWPGQNPIGLTFREGGEGQLRHVVGIVPNIAQRSIGESSRPHFYQPLSRDSYESPLMIVVRTDGSPVELVDRLRDAVHRIAPALPVRSAQTLRQRMALPLWMPRTLTRFFMMCALLAVVLATVGLFGVTYYVVLQRTREFGVRLALGSDPGSLKRLVVSESVRLVSPGILIGILAAFAAALAARSLLFGVTVTNPTGYVVAAMAQALAAVGTSWIPAIRAARVDPVVALRAD
jgi:predicted permease